MSQVPKIANKIKVEVLLPPPEPQPQNWYEYKKEHALGLVVGILLIFLVRPNASEIGQVATSPGAFVIDIPSPKSLQLQALNELHES